MTAFYKDEFLLKLNEEIKGPILATYMKKNGMNEPPESILIPENISLESFSKFLLIVNRGYLTGAKWNKPKSKMTSNLLLELIILLDFFGYSSEMLAAWHLLFKKPITVIQWNNILLQIFDEENGLKEIFNVNFPLFGSTFFKELKSVFTKWKLMSPDIYLSCTRLLNQNKNGNKVSFSLCLWEELILKAKNLFSCGWISQCIPLIEMLLYFNTVSPEKVISAIEERILNPVEFYPGQYHHVAWDFPCAFVLQQPCSSFVFHVEDMGLSLNASYSHVEEELKVILRFHDFHKIHQPDRVFVVYVRDSSAKNALRLSPLLLSSNQIRGANTSNLVLKEKPSSHVIKIVKAQPKHIKNSNIRIRFYIKELVVLTALGEWMNRAEYYINEEAREAFLREKTATNSKNLIKTMTPNKLEGSFGGTDNNLSNLKPNQTANIREELSIMDYKGVVISESCPIQPGLSKGKKLKSFQDCACSENIYVANWMVDSSILKNERVLEKFSRISNILIMEMLSRRRSLYEKLELKIINQK